MNKFGGAYGNLYTLTLLVYFESSLYYRHPLDRLLASYLEKRDLGKDWDEGVGNRSWPQFVQHMLEIPKGTSVMMKNHLLSNVKRAL